MKRTSARQVKHISNILSVFRFLAFGLLFVDTSAFCAGGPNMIEGTSIVGLWLLPGIGSVLLFVILVAANWRQAIVTAFVLIFVLFVLVASSPVAFLGVLLLGPWFVFVSLVLVAAYNFLLGVCKGSRGVKESRSSRLLRNKRKLELNELDAMAHVRVLEDQGFIVEGPESGRWTVIHPKSNIAHYLYSIEDLALYVEQHSPGNA